MTFKTQYEFGDIVYLITDEQQNEYQMQEILLSQRGHQFYIVRGYEEPILVYEFQISKNLDTVKKLYSNEKETD